VLRLTKQSRDENGLEFGVAPSLYPPTYLFALGSWDFPYVTCSGKAGQEGKNITPQLEPSWLPAEFRDGRKKMKGAQKEMGKNRLHVKRRWIPLALGIPLHSALLLSWTAGGRG
jgi:hypothetical protein